MTNFQFLAVIIKIIIKENYVYIVKYLIGITIRYFFLKNLACGDNGISCRTRLY